MHPKDVRQHVTEIEIHATPDQVFGAVTKGEQIRRWFPPSYFASWEPARRFTTEDFRSPPSEADGAETQQRIRSHPQWMVPFSGEPGGSWRRLIGSSDSSRRIPFAALHGTETGSSPPEAFLRRVERSMTPPRRGSPGHG